MRNKYLCLALWGLCTLHAFSQKSTISGRVYDTSATPLPFATLHFEGTTIGTTTNKEGFYTIQTSLEGTYQLIAQYPGMKAKKSTLTLLGSGATFTLDFVLKEEEAIEAISVSAKAINYADEVIRNAQKNRKVYLAQSPDFKCESYVKGLAKLTTFPKSVLGSGTAGLDTGIVYLSESVSEISFQKNPRNYKEVVTASKVSGDSKGFTFNQVASWNFNFYTNLVGQGLSERGFVSPIASNAFSYYNYKWEGQFTEDSIVINKIKVIPKRNTDPVWEGYMYITENTWRIHSVDLSFDKNRPVDFVKGGRIRQIFAPLGKNSVLLSQNFSYEFGFFGFKGDGYFNKIYTNHVLNPAFEKGFFGRDLIIVEEKSNKKDTSFWKKIRPVPLLISEKEDYRKKDSVEVVHETKGYKDSIDKINNTFKFNNLLTGYTFQNTFKKSSISFQSPLNEYSFNTIEGYVINFNINYQKELENQKRFNISPTLRYGFVSTTLYGKLRMSYTSNQRKSERWDVEGGYFVEQFNPNAIQPVTNTITSIYQRYNFMKLYQKTFGKFSYRREALPGLIVVATGEYAVRKELENKTNWSFVRRGLREYTPNLPFNNELPNAAFGTSNALLFGLNLSFTPKQRYISRPDVRIRVNSKYPTFGLEYQKGVAALGSNVNFDKIEFSVKDNYRLGLLGSGTYTLFGGTFLSTKSLTFIDYKHFDGNRVMLAFPSFRAYQLLDYYAFSTAKQYAGANLEHHFNGLFFNRVPLLKKTRIQEVFTCNYLFTETNGNYIELGAGLEHIFKFLRVDYFWSFVDGKAARQGVRFGIGF